MEPHDGPLLPLNDVRLTTRSADALQTLMDRKAMTAECVINNALRNYLRADDLINEGRLLLRSADGKSTGEVVIL